MFYFVQKQRSHEHGLEIESGPAWFTIGDAAWRL
jgi:hypothetical protein